MLSGLTDRRLIFMLKQFSTVMPALLALCLVIGCGKKSSATSGTFGAASPELKQLWDAAVTADKADDYVTAATDYQMLRAKQGQLSADQLLAVKDAALNLNQRMTAAANAGDAAAKSAAQKLAGMQNAR
jgi:hypothetical protein